MNITILTRSVAPICCGIGDHTVHVAKALQASGAEVHILAGQGESNNFNTIIPDEWDDAGLEKLLRRLQEMDIEHLLMQFTPLTFGGLTNDIDAIALFWRKCSKIWSTNLIVHETYFRTWWYPPSWINGYKEKRLLKNMVANTHFVFSASQPLVQEMKSWQTSAEIHYLPVGSNFSFVESDRVRFRAELGIGADEMLMTLFGGGNTLKWMRSHVNVTDALLCDSGIRARWLLLGGVSAEWFKLTRPAIVPGKLEAKAISAYLQASDIFLMPHYAGLCAKRGTLMAAMQHALPVVGTRTAMTDDFWDKVDGVRLVPRRSRMRFGEEVLKLALDHQLRKQLGGLNRCWFDQYCTWPVISRQLLEVIQ